MLAKPAKEPFDDQDWLFEIKWDGYRAIADLQNKSVDLYSRNGNSFVANYPELIRALGDLQLNAILDGEIVAFNDQGMPDFQSLQQYGQAPVSAIEYYVFDLLFHNGKDYRDRPLIERKAQLSKLIPEEGRLIRYCDHIEGEGIHFFDAIKEKGLEGMIAKRMDSNYREGTRNGAWLKIKHLRMEEAIIAGFTKVRSGKGKFGALVLGAYQNGNLTYIGHTGTGFNESAKEQLYDAMNQLVTEESPFNQKIKVNMPVTWIRPKLVCQIKYSEITRGGQRRHPVFLGLRTDKSAGEVTINDHIMPAKKAGSLSKSSKDTKSIGKARITNPDKIYWPDEGITKGDMIAYYESVAPYILPHLKARPQSLNRNPNGIKGKNFYHKDAGEQAPDWVATYQDWSESSNKTVDYLVCNNKSSLLYLANLGCIELNPWHSRVTKPDHPDYLALDLDPSEKNSFDDVVDCAIVMKEILDEAGADSYCKTSGATGLHIYIPLGAKYDYAQARGFAEIIAQMTLERLPDLTTMERSLSKRSKQKIYLDYLQNKQGATLAAAYSLRPRPGAPVSTPLDWKEVKSGLDPLQFNIKNTLQRIKRKGDIFLPVLKKGIDMKKVLKNLEKMG